MPEARPDACSASPIPYFSVVIPMYNRARTIGRCLESCLTQSFEDFEVIVVDDASDEDDSVEVVKRYQDPRVRLIQNPVNLGVCASRGVGVEHARGQWILYRDSDDAFMPDAFARVFAHTQSAPATVGEVRFCVRVEALNNVAPFPPPPTGIVTFAGYLRWLDDVVNSDLCACHRRTIFGTIQWPTDRRFETHFFLRLASKFDILMVDEVVAVMYDDADNRITATGRRRFDARSLRIARDNALAATEIINEFGTLMARYCPKRYRRTRRMIGNHHLRAGNRVRGIRAMLGYLGRWPYDLAAWGLLAAGLCGPRVMHFAFQRIRYR